MVLWSYQLIWLLRLKSRVNGVFVSLVLVLQAAQIGDLEVVCLL